jgi:DNA-binding NarL/FixJ family response regulator
MKIRVAIVDDDQDMVVHLRWVLHHLEEFEVAGVYGDGTEALRGVRRIKPDVVLMDNRMPDISGIECTRRLKAVQRDVKVVLMSAFMDADCVLEALEASADGFLDKSDPEVDYRRAIHEVLEGGSPLSAKAARVVWQALRQQSAANRMVVALTPQQTRVLELMADGKTDKEIASALEVCVTTVRTHAEQVFMKLSVHTRSGAVGVYLGRPPRATP